jgi:hypothetical protein
VKILSFVRIKKKTFNRRSLLNVLLVGAEDILHYFVESAAGCEHLLREEGANAPSSLKVC